MIKTAVASTALFAAHALAQGSAIVINACSYDVYVDNTPSADGVHSPVNQVLSPGGQYSQVFTALANGNGWSIKLGKTQNAADIMQYEYTYTSDGSPTIWYDLSDVNGNPWDGNWEITATGSCHPRHAAYRFSTDDAYGMQACPSSSSITVTLCSGTSGGHPHPHPPHKHHHHHHHKPPPPPPVSSPPESVAPTPTSAAPTTSEAPSPATTTTYYTQSYHHFGGPPADKVQEAAGGKKKLGGHHNGQKSPTTFVTASSPPGPAVTVTNMKYETVVKYVTATA